MIPATLDIPPVFYHPRTEVKTSPEDGDALFYNFNEQTFRVIRGGYRLRCVQYDAKGAPRLDGWQFFKLNADWNAVASEIAKAWNLSAIPIKPLGSGGLYWRLRSEGREK